MSSIVMFCALASGCHKAPTETAGVFDTVRVREWNVFLIRRRKGGIGDARGCGDGISLFQN